MKSILIIEDDALVSRTVASHLSRKGYDVAVAGGRIAARTA